RKTLPALRLVTWPTRTALPGEPAPAVSCPCPALNAGTSQVTPSLLSTRRAGTTSASSGIRGMLTLLIGRDGSGVGVGTATGEVSLAYTPDTRLRRPTAPKHGRLRSRSTATSLNSPCQTRDTLTVHLTLRPLGPRSRTPYLERSPTPRTEKTELEGCQS